MSKKVLPDLYEKYIKNTGPQAIVINKTVFLCHLTNAVSKGIGIFPTNKIYTTSRVIKHMYDKKPAEEFDFLINCVHRIVKFPDKVYQNQDAKRGDFCFVKNLNGRSYFCSIQIVRNDGGDTEDLYLATAFRIRKINYLDNYKLLWSWKDGAPSS